MKALLIKMSSLGDVVHALPALSAAAQQGVRFDWVVEEAYQAIGARHPAVDKVKPIALRRWRKAPWRCRKEIRAFFSALPLLEYDLVLDAQGLLKSAVVASRARGRETVGFVRRHAKESITARYYDRRVEAPRGQHAIDRQLQLFAGAFGYPYRGADAYDFGLSSWRQRTNDCVFLHGSSWASKQWPVDMWADLAKRAGAAGLQVLLPWGDEGERRRAEAVVARGGGQVLNRLELSQMLPLLQCAKLVVGVDSGLTHLAAALGAPTVALYGSTSAALTGCRGPSASVLVSAFGCAPCQKRTCRYRGPGRFWRDAPVVPPCYGELPPGRVWAQAEALMEAGSG